MPPRDTPTVGQWPDPAERYLDLIGAGDEGGAVALVNRLLDDGAPAERVLLDVISAAQARVGQLWADNQWSVAREHAATAISERAVAAVAARAGTRPYRGRLTVACVDGEWHALPGRILAEVLRLRGWRVDYLGANVPGPHLVTHLHQTDADAVALSCMLPTRLPRAHATIAACRAVGVPVIAGGPGFGPDGRHARLLGADTWAASADAAANDLASGDWPPPTAPDPGIHYASEEYHRLVRRRPELIDASWHRLASAYPPVADYDQQQRESTLDDLGHIVDFLAAALYVGDPRVFTDFAAWTTQVLAARDVPGVAVTTGMDILHELLGDQPRARYVLKLGMRQVRAVAGERMTSQHVAA
jgi:methanogenic corrinoid protein MtbC1